jgi:hypothetical protein
MLSGAVKFNDTLRPAKQGLEIKLRILYSREQNTDPLKLYDTKCV